MSDFLKLNLNDIFKGLLMAVLTPVVVIIQQSLEAGVFVFDWKSIGSPAVVGSGAGVANIIFTYSL